ncbi:DUF2167 domain-containing protein [Persicirhabdus sediminis]|uniref:DUF2167 domain-containing protein n=1 Tax=Persicirhabdus sediminis TaxID=454144 RepID=A0A8J7MI00_9BACT|nr:DUF2167 domain-containing protein [Persicirhabdus sediminis]MBK1792334.1 DUF2167 domain-containing protein [Persicirhabdus sediminis]
MFKHSLAYISSLSLAMMLAGGVLAADEPAEETSGFSQLSAEEAFAFESGLVSSPLPDSQTNSSSSPQNDRARLLNKFAWQRDGIGHLGEWSKVRYTSGYLFLDGKEAKKFMKEIDNLPGNPVGLLAPSSLDWFVIFDYEPCGYVNDDDQGELDADALLKALKADDKRANAQRRSMGIRELYTESWALKPSYNAQTNNLEWAVILRSPDGEKSINYMTKLLGRDGIMHLTLVCYPEELNSLRSDYQKIIAGHRYNAGKSYQEYTKGDKLAGYGLSALVAGGAIYGASKLGLLGQIGLLFKKGIKLIIVGVIAVAAFFKRLVFGRSE